jgi:hypothetical protein
MKEEPPKWGLFSIFRRKKRMRKLNTFDLFRTAAILGKIGTNLKITADMDPKQLGVSFFACALQYAETDLKNLLANISEMSTEEFEKMPFDYPLELIENLIESEDIKSFLERAKSLTRKMQGESKTESVKGITGA